MEFCVNFDDGTHCIYCGVCGLELCREHTNSPCTHCNNCELGSVTLD